MGIFESSKIEFPDSHGEGVFDRVRDVDEFLQFRVEHEVEEATEGEERDGELNDKRWEADKTQAHGGRHLLECLLETVKNAINHLRENII